MIITFRRTVRQIVVIAEAKKPRNCRVKYDWIQNETVYLLYDIVERDRPEPSVLYTDDDFVANYENSWNGPVSIATFTWNCIYIYLCVCVCVSMCEIIRFCTFKETWNYVRFSVYDSLLYIYIFFFASTKTYILIRVVCVYNVTRFFGFWRKMKHVRWRVGNFRFFPEIFRKLYRPYKQYYPIGRHNRSTYRVRVRTMDQNDILRGRLGRLKCFSFSPATVDRNFRKEARFRSDVHIESVIKSYMLSSWF